MISPSEIQKALTTTDQDLLRQAEKHIDEALQREFGNRPEVWINIQPAWTPRIVEELIRRYRAAGWKVRKECDQRDGNALVFIAGAT